MSALAAAVLAYQRAGWLCSEPGVDDDELDRRIGLVHAAGLEIMGLKAADRADVIAALRLAIEVAREIVRETGDVRRGEVLTHLIGEAHDSVSPRTGAAVDVVIAGGFPRAAEAA
jgi:hypothetical protein